MINFIKQAVESVEGIKSFLFNTDYRNNFDLQNVEFPCCVLTPIMRTNYDLNNIIRESAELQLSVVDSAPYEYTGDDLYAINKRCSDLALQVIANLQVKSKLDKELTFEFILPSGDELISGVMCNLQCTMKQGSCIGAPSYIEIVVQPIKKVSITSNGKHVISADKGFNAMREVEVDVQIGELTTEEKIVDITSNGEVEILPTNADAMTKVTANVQVPPPPLEEKQVTITKAKTTEIITPDTEYGLSRVEVSTDIPLESRQITITENGTTTIEASEGFEGIESVDVEVDVKPNLQDKSVTITENGTQTVTADSEFEGLNSVEVTTDVNTLQGLDLSPLGNSEELTRLNSEWINNEVQRTLKRAKQWSNNNFITAGRGFWIGSTYRASEQDPYIFYTKLDGIATTHLMTLFSGNTKVRYIYIDDAIYNAKFISLSSAFSGVNYSCWLQGVDFGTQNDYSNVTTCENMFYNAVCNEFIKWGNLKYCEKITTWKNAFNSCRDIPKIIDFEFAPFVQNAINFSGMFYFGGGTFAGSATRIKGLDIINGTTFGRFLGYRSITECVELKNWKQGNFDFTQQQNTYIINTMKYMIFHAVDSEQGAVNRSMTLHATPKNKWLNEVANSKPTQDDCDILGVEDYDRYGDLTWEEIASTIKDITIA